jgi:TetR/AcrR family transcriptional repressor of mexJK operon
MTSRIPPGRPVDPGKDQDILAAAHELLFQLGPRAVTMEAVAALAGVSKATVYSRHANRDALIRAVIQQQAQQFTEAFSVASETLEDLQVALSQFVIRLSTFLSSQEHVLLMHALGSARRLDSALLQDIYRGGPQRTHDGLSGWLRATDQAGLIRCDNPERSAELLLGMLMGLDLVRAVYGVTRTRTADELEAQARFVVESFLRLHRVSTAESNCD